MKFFALAALFAAVVSAYPQSAIPKNIQASHVHHVYTYTTLLDHFNPQNYVEVNFTFYDQEDYFRPNGPIYIYIQDNGVLTTDLLDTGVMHDLAEETGAVLVTASNRYFRDNLPTANASVSNLQYLTVDQILADIPYLIAGVRHNLEGSENSKVILFGSGLGATLAVWARQKYPHLIDGVWSSSGVFQRVVESAVPLENLSSAIERIGGAECANDLGEAYESIALLLYRRQVDKLRNEFDICFAISYYNSYDVASFYFGINQVLINHIDVNNAFGIQRMCSALANKNASSQTPELDAFGAWFRSVFTDEFCLDVNIGYRANEAWQTSWEFIRYLHWNPLGINIGYPFPSRPSLWLACTQLGGWATSVNSQSLFQHSIGQDTFFRFCQQSFDEYDYAHLAGSVASLNNRFGGNNPSISKVIYTNADLDPWASFGVREEQRTANSHVFNLADYGKSADLFSIRPENSPLLVDIKQRIEGIVAEWGTIEIEEPNFNV